MLRITRFEIEPAKLVLKLEGIIGGLWIEEVRRTCLEYQESGRQIELNLEGVPVVELEGIRLLRDLKAGGVVISHAPQFVVELLRSNSTSDES